MHDTTSLNWKWHTNCRKHHGGNHSSQSSVVSSTVSSKLPFAEIFVGHWHFPRGLQSWRSAIAWNLQGISFVQGSVHQQWRDGHARETMALDDWSAIAGMTFPIISTCFDAVWQVCAIFKTDRSGVSFLRLTWILCLQKGFRILPLHYISHIMNHAINLPADVPERQGNKWIKKKEGKDKDYLVFGCFWLHDSQAVLSSNVRVKSIGQVRHWLVHLNRYPILPIPSQYLRAEWGLGGCEDGEGPENTEDDKSQNASDLGRSGRVERPSKRRWVKWNSFWWYRNRW